MDRYVIDGGYPLEGSIRISGNKNGALTLLAAALLSESKVILHNIPDIADVQVMIQLMRHLGVEVGAIEKGRVEINPCGLCISLPHLPSELVDDIRASLLLLGPVLGRKGKVLLPPPGGDVIGLRRLDTQISAIEDDGRSLCGFTLKGNLRS